jgi:Putative metallopeptidase
MKAVLALVITWAVLVPEMATTAQAAAARASRVSVSYVPPKNPAHQPIYEQLKQLRFLEKLQRFLTPFRLPRALLVKVEGCDGDANAFYEYSVITVCYEYIDQLWKTMPAETTTTGVTPIDAIVGPLFDTCLHEFGHALFDLLRVPVLGREEDAADQVSAYLMLHLGKAEARRLIEGVAYAYRIEAEADTAPLTMTRFADVHGTPAQRFYNVLCIAYGADAKLFGDMVEKGYLPKERAEDCQGEYQQIAGAYEKLIGPHVDRSWAKKVFDKSWLPDATTRVPGRPPSPQPTPQTTTP